MPRRLAIACSLLGLLALCSLLAGIIRTDKANRVVELVVALDDVVRPDSEYRAWVWEKLRAAGATAIVVRERTLGEEADAGNLTIAGGKDVLDAFRVQELFNGYIWEEFRKRQLPADHTYVIASQRKHPELFARLHEAFGDFAKVLTRRPWSADQQVIEVEAPKAVVRELGIGLQPLPPALAAAQPRLMVLSAPGSCLRDYFSETGVVASLVPVPDETGEYAVFPLDEADRSRGYPQGMTITIVFDHLGAEIPSRSSIVIERSALLQAAMMQRRRLLWLNWAVIKQAAQILQGVNLQVAPIDWQQLQQQRRAEMNSEQEIKWHFYLLPLLFVLPCGWLLRQLPGGSEWRALGAAIAVIALVALAFWHWHAELALTLLCPLLACLIIPAAAVAGMPPLPAERYAGGRGVLLIFARAVVALGLVLIGGLAAYAPLVLVRQWNSIGTAQEIVAALVPRLRWALLASLTLLALVLYRRLFSPGRLLSRTLTLGHLAAALPVGLLLFAARDWAGQAPSPVGVILATCAGVFGLMLFSLFSLIGRSRAALVCGLLGGYGLAALLTLFLQFGVHSTLLFSQLAVALAPALVLAAVAFIAVVGALGLSAKWRDLPR